MKKHAKILVVLLVVAMLCTALVMISSADSGEVASIGDEKYFTFEDAFANAKNGDVIQLLSNVSFEVSTPLVVDKDLTIDLGGYSITTLSASVFVVNGDVNFTVRGNGSIKTPGTFITNNSGAPTVNLAGGNLGLGIDNAAATDSFAIMNGGSINVTNVNMLSSTTIKNFYVFNLVGTARANFLGSNIEIINDTQTNKACYVLYIAGDSCASIKYSTLFSNSRMIWIDSTANGAKLNTGDERNTILYSEGSEILARASESKSAIAIGSGKSPVGGDIVLKDSYIEGSYEVITLGETTDSYVYLYNTTLYHNGGSKSSPIINRNTPMYMDATSKIVSVKAATYGNDKFYATIGTRISNDKHITSGIIIDAEGKQYQATLNAAEGPTFIWDPVGDPYAPYVVVESSQGVPMSPTYYFLADSLIVNNNNGVGATLYDGAGATSADVLKASGMAGSLATGTEKWMKFHGQLLNSSLVNGKVIDNTCIRYTGDPGTDDYKLSQSTDFILSEAKNSQLNAFEKNEDGQFVHNVFVIQSMFATDTGEFVPARFQMHAMDTASATNDLSGAKLQLSADGTVTMGNDSYSGSYAMMTDEGKKGVKAYNDGRWNTIEIVIYRNPDKDGVDCGLAYFYFNGILMGRDIAYDCGSSGAGTKGNGQSWLWGTRVHTEKGNINPKTQSLLVDNAVLMAYPTELTVAEGTKKGTYAHDSKYFVDFDPNSNHYVPASIGALHFESLSDAINKANELGVNLYLEDDITTEQTVLATGTLVANGHTIILSENSYPADIKIVDSTILYYEFNEAYANFKLPVAWYNGPLDKAEEFFGIEEYYVMTEVSVGSSFEAPAGFGTSVPDYKTCSICTQTGWKTSYHKEQVYTNSLPAFSLTEMKYILDTDGYLQVDPVITLTMMTAVLEKDGEGVAYSTSTNMGSSDLPYKMQDGQTLKLFDDIQITSTITFSKAGEYNIDLNGHALYNNGGRSTLIKVSTENVTLNVYSSAPGGSLFHMGYSKPKVGGVVIQVNISGYGQSQETTDKIVGGLTSMNVDVNIGKYGDIPGSNTTIAGDTMIQYVQGDKTCDINVDGATLYAPACGDRQCAIQVIYFSGNVNLKNATYISGSQSLLLGTSDDDRAVGHKAIATVDNCLFLVTDNSATPEFPTVFGHKLTGFESITVTNTISTVPLDDNKGNSDKIIIGEGCVSTGFTNNLAEGIVKAYYNKPLELPEGIPTKFANASIVSNVLTFDYITYIIPYGASVPEGLTQYDTVIMLPLLTYKSVKAEDAITVTYNDFAGNVIDTQYYVSGADYVTSDKTPTGAEYNAIKLAFAGWNEVAPATVTAPLTFTPKAEIAANIKGLLANLSIYADFNINVFLPIAYKAYVTSITVGGTELNMVEVDMNDDGAADYIKVTVKVAPDKADENVVFTINVSENGANVTCTATVSIASYAEAILGGNYTAAEKQLMYYTAAYANEAYKYFGNTAENNETLAALLANYESAKGEYVADETYAGAVTDTGLAGVFANATVDLGSAPKFVFTFKEGFAGTVTITYGHYSNTVTYTVTAEDSRTITLTGMKAYNFTTDIFVTAEGTIGGEEVKVNGTYNLDTFVKFHADNAATNEESAKVLALLKSFYDYCVVANAYKV